MAFTPDGRELVSAAFRRGPEGLFVEVSSWDTASGEPSRWFTCRAAVEAIAFSADCERVAWASRDEIAIWDVRGQKPIRTIRRDGQFERRIERGLAFSPAGKTVSCLTYRDFTIRHWDFERQRETTTPLSLPLRFRAKYPVSDVVSVGHRERLVISSREHLHIIDAATGEVLRQMKVPRCERSRLAVSPDGRLLARGGRPQDYLGHSDRSIRVYDWETGREILRLEPLDTATACLRFSRDGKYLISGMYDGTTLLWDLDGAWQDSRRLFDGESQRQSPHRSGSPVGRPARPPHRLHAGPQ